MVALTELLKVVKQVADGFLCILPKGTTLSTLGRRVSELGSNMHMFYTPQECCSVKIGQHDD